VPSKPLSDFSPDPENSGEPLTELADFVGSYVAFSSVEARDAVALWIAHTHAVDHFDITPRLHVRSPERRSGKTRLLEVTQGLAARPSRWLNLSAPSLFRTLRRAESDGEPPPTILIDEADTIFKSNNKEDDSGKAELRALLNGGYARGARVPRCVGAQHDKVEEFPSFAPVALAGIGHLPDTIEDRSVGIDLQRRHPHEVVTRFRQRDFNKVAEPLRERLSGWVESQGVHLVIAAPRMPDGLTDRAEDIWEPLVAIADCAGGAWPKRGRQAATKLSHLEGADDGSRAVRLLADIQTIFNDPPQVNRLRTSALLEKLNGLEEAEWGDMWGKPLDGRRLARMLKPYGATPRAFKDEADKTVKGYRREELTDVWSRYLPSTPTRPQTVTAVTTVTGNSDGDLGVTDVTDVTVPGRAGLEPTLTGGNGVGIEAQTPVAGHPRPDLAADKLVWPEELTRHGGDA
jgi:hypothetical protein